MEQSISDSIQPETQAIEFKENIPSNNDDKKEETNMEEEVEETKIEPTMNMQNNDKKGIVEEMMTQETQGKLQKIREKFKEQLLNNKPVIYFDNKVS